MFRYFVEIAQNPEADPESQIVSTAKSPQQFLQAFGDQSFASLVQGNLVLSFPLSRLKTIYILPTSTIRTCSSVNEEQNLLISWCTWLAAAFECDTVLPSDNGSSRHLAMVPVLRRCTQVAARIACVKLCSLGVKLFDYMHAVLADLQVNLRPKDVIHDVTCPNNALNLCTA